MTVTLLRRIMSARYIFLLSGLALILWSLAISITPKSSALSALLRMDFDRCQDMTSPVLQHSIDATNGSLSDISIPNNPKVHVGIGVPRTYIYVISLADRQDRRAQMELLRTIQGLAWTVIDAVPGNSTLVNHILNWVVYHRAERRDVDTLSFRWPEEIDALTVSHELLKQAGSDIWPEALPPSNSKARKVDPSINSTLPCAIEDVSIPTFSNGTPQWMVLSPAKIACWHSHVLAIRRFVDRHDLHSHLRGDSDVAIILEDDIDMEKEVSARLIRVWTSLPAGWDVVFLGHCWSDENHYPALTQFSGVSIHPSYYPKCTHAYALSLSGARRLLQHLRYPPFAYSRALDQAYAWLIRNGRLRSYSIVPSLVVQRKIGSSDISPGSGSEWRERLHDGVLQASTS